MSNFYKNLFRDIPEPDRDQLQRLAIALTKDIKTVPDTLETIDQLESDYESVGIEKVLEYYGVMEEIRE